MMMKVTNTNTAPRGVYIGSAVKYWQPGEVKELALSETDLLEVRGMVGMVVESAPAAEVAKPAKAQKPTT